MSQSNLTLCAGIQSVVIEPIMLSVVMLSVVMLSVTMLGLVVPLYVTQPSTLVPFVFPSNSVLLNGFVRLGFSSLRVMTDKKSSTILIY